MYVMNHTLMRTKKNRQSIAAQGGFSIIEMMVVVMIVGIIAGIAITSYRGQLPQSRLRLVTTELHSTFNLSRVMAMSQNATFTVKLSGGAAEAVSGTTVTVTAPITATIVKTVAGVDSQITATTFHADVSSITVTPGLVVGTARPWVRFNSMGFRAGAGNQLLVLTNTQGRVHSIGVMPGGKAKWCLTSTC
jgi:type IV pilus assembly protein PilE